MILMTMKLNRVSVSILYRWLPSIEYTWTGYELEQAVAQHEVP